MTTRLDKEREALDVISGDPPTIADSERWEDALATLLALIERVEKAAVGYAFPEDVESDSSFRYGDDYRMWRSLEPTAKTGPAPFTSRRVRYLLIPEPNDGK